TGAVEAVTVRYARQDVHGVVGHGDRAAVTEHDHVVAYRAGRVGDGANLVHALLQRLRRLCADGPARGHAHMGDHDVGTRRRHLPRLLGIEHVGCGEEVERVGGGYHLHFQPVAHASLLEALPHGAV